MLREIFWRSHNSLCSLVCGRWMQTVLVGMDLWPLMGHSPLTLSRSVRIQVGKSSNSDPCEEAGIAMHWRRKMV